MRIMKADQLQLRVLIKDSYLSDNIRLIVDMG